jgi:hypothetical protein
MPATRARREWTIHEGIGLLFKLEFELDLFPRN